MKAIQLLVNSQLPDDLKDYERPMDKKSIAALLADVARKYPERYEEIAKTIADLGRKASYLQGETLTLKDTQPVFDRQKLFDKMDNEIATAKRTLNDTDFKRARTQIWSKYADEITGTTQRESLAQGSDLANTVISGARGNASQLRMMVSTPALYTDSKDEIVPLFVRRSFGDGLRPAEYLASTYGARKSVLSTKRATAKGGDLAKQLVQVNTPLIVTTSDCGVRNGVDLEIDDSSLRGRVLAEDYGPIKAGTILDRQALNELKNKQGLKKLIVRSALTCDAEEGICAKCVGVNPKGQFPELGDTIGITAAQSVGEPITQGALNCLVVGTEVLMHDYSIKKIESVEVGDLVMGADVNGNVFPTKVTATWDQGLQPVQRRYYKMGQTKQLITLDSTSEHPVLSNRKTYSKNSFGKNNDKAEKLVAGYPHKNLAAVLPVENLTGGISEVWAPFLGVYLGDGIRWDNELHAAPCISCADLSEIEDLNKILNPLGVTLKKSKRSFDWRVVMMDDDLDSYRDNKGQVIEGARSPVKQKLLEWGLAKKYAHQKDIPQVVWTWGSDSVAALLAGFIAADGSVYTNKEGHISISFSSNSYAMMASLKRLLQLKLCVYSSALTCIGKAGEGNRKHDQWQFTITRHDQVTKLAKHVVPLLPGVKSERLATLLENANYEIRNPDWFYRAKRVDTEELGIKQCYDITVEHEDSLFVLANSLIVSNTKHSGGAAQGAKRTYAGFDVINRFVQAPEEFPDRAVVAKQDGVVSKIEEAPQGGYFVHVGNEQHYVPPGYPVLVKRGDNLEAGDQLSEGLVDASDIVELRGIGEGRRYYSDRLKQILDDSGMTADRRNTEIIARSALNHLQMEDADDDAPFLPDDVISYQQMSRHYTPPEDTARENVQKAVGKYLQQPMLHYTIGTRITPSVAKRLEEVGKKEVYASAKAPNFSPNMVRLRTASHANRDWMAGMHTSYLKKNLAESAIRGDDTNVRENVHFAPRLAIGEGFAQNITETGKF